MLGYQHECGWPQLLVKSLYVQHSDAVRCAFEAHEADWGAGPVIWSLYAADRAVATASRPLVTASA